MKTYFVQNKADDYGNCRTELIQTQPHLAKQYYHHKEVLEQDVDTLKRYIDLIPYEEEVGRTEDERFYGHD